MSIDTGFGTTSQTRLFKRSLTTIRANLALARRLHARRRNAPVMKAIHYFEIAAIAFSAILIAAVLLDGPVAAARGQYPAWVVMTGEYLTRLGKSDWILIPSGVILILLTFRNVERLTTLGRMRIFRWNLYLSYIFVGVGLPSLVSTLVKRLIGRPRPISFDASGLFDLHPIFGGNNYASFPSGHSTTIGALAVVLAILAPRYRTFFLVAAMLIGASRIALGAHHPSDVIGGLLFGAATAYFIARLAATYGLMFLDKDSPWPELRPAFRPGRLLE